MTAPTAAPQTRSVRLQQLPVQVWAASQEHHDELFREFALITAGLAEHDADSAPVPLRLLRLVEHLTRSYGGSADAQREQLFAAAVRGEQVIDELVYELPVAAGPATEELGRLLDEADDYCRQGEHLLTLATPDDIRLFRSWYLGEVRHQLAGGAPVPWPQFLASSQGSRPD